MLLSACFAWQKRKKLSPGYVYVWCDRFRFTKTRPRGEIKKKQRLPLQLIGATCIHDRRQSPCIFAGVISVACRGGQKFKIRSPPFDTLHLSKGRCFFIGGGGGLGGWGGGGGGVGGGAHRWGFCAAVAGRRSNVAVRQSARARGWCVGTDVTHPVTYVTALHAGVIQTARPSRQRPLCKRRSDAGFRFTSLVYIQRSVDADR